MKWYDGFQSATVMLFLQEATAASAGGTGNVFLINDPLQGIDGNQRIGRQIVVKSILVRACIQVPTADEGVVSYSQCVRIMIVKDRQCNGLGFNIGDLLDDTGTHNVVTAPMNLTYRQRFKVLCDRHYVLSGASNAAEFYFEYFKQKNHRIEYTSNVQGIAGIRTNAIYVILLGPYATAGGTVANRPHLSSYLHRIRFVDA